MSPLTELPAKFRDKLVQSRFFTISATVHFILLALVGTTIYYKVLPPPEKGMSSEELVNVQDVPPRPPAERVAKIKLPDPTSPAQAKVQFPAPNLDIIKTTQLTDAPVADLNVGVIVPAATGIEPPTPAPNIGELSRDQLRAIGQFTKWRTGKETFAFTAYLGRYQGGNWSSTVRMSGNQITGGSLPNLLYCTSKWSKDKIKTNERQVKAIDLASDELLATKPPFIFLTGTRDFKLTDKEVENLNKYIRSGGAVWGDSSVPGRRSAFDVAFCREMKRVLPDKDKQFEALPANHPVFAQGYFKKITSLPSGINQYREPVEVLKWGGEVAIIHTINDYGDMWQIGLDKNARIDLSRNDRGEYVAMNATLWDQRGLYVRNIEQPAVEQAYEFGINMIVHLLTRWENRTASVGAL